VWRAATRGRVWRQYAAVNPARLRRDQSRRSEARDLLAPVYGWFTEGFNTTDLAGLAAGAVNTDSHS
jgi:predicted ATPase